MIYIIILHWNNYRCSNFCLEYLQNVTYENLKIIIVDNGSTDDSFIRIKEKYPRYIYLENYKNLGFAKGTNTGLKYAYDMGADYVLVLNNDVEVSPNFIEPMLKSFASIPNVGIVTPKIMHRDDRKLIWHLGGYINHYTISGVAKGYKEIDAGQYEKEFETSWASGACCLISRRVIDKIGFYDEKYFFGQEEWDYSTMAIKNGFKILYSPESIVYHEVGGSTLLRPSLSAYQNIYNKLHYAKKHLPSLHYYAWTLFYFAYLVAVFPKPSQHNIKIRGEYFMMFAKRAALRGFIDFFKGIKIDSDHLNKIENEYKALFARFKNQ